MSIKVRWIPTSAEAYSALRQFHHEAMNVHGTITDLGEYNEQPPRTMTEWGLKGADAPLIKRDDRGGVSHYFIAVVTEDNE